MSRFATALAVLNDMKAAGVVQEYAVAGAMAIVFWSERRERAALLAESPHVDPRRLRDVLQRYGLDF